MSHIAEFGEGFRPLRPRNGGDLVLHSLGAHADGLLPADDQIAAREQEAVHSAVLLLARRFDECGLLPLCSRYRMPA